MSEHKGDPDQNGTVGSPESVEEKLPATLATKDAIGKAISGNVTEIEDFGVESFLDPENGRTVYLTVSYPKGVLRRVFEEHIVGSFVGDVDAAPTKAAYEIVRYELMGEGDGLELMKRISFRADEDGKFEDRAFRPANEAEAKHVLLRMASLEPT